MLIRPDIYETLEKGTGNPEIEMAGIVEVEEVIHGTVRTHSNIDQDKFNQMVKDRTSMIRNPRVVADVTHESNNWENRNKNNLNDNFSSEVQNPISITKI